MRVMAQFRPELLQPLTALLQAVNPCVQAFLFVRGWTIRIDELSHFQMTIREERRPQSEHIGRYNGSTASKVAAVISYAEDGIAGLM